MDSRFNIGPSFKRHKKRKPILEDDRFNRLKDFEKLEKYTDAIVDPFGRPIVNKSIDTESQYDSDNEYIESNEVNLIESSSIWDREGDIQLGDPTDRIAVIGCDWDNINSTDIFVLFQTMYDSYTLEKNIEGSNVIKRVSIYLSEFGKTRVYNENVNGPTLSKSVSEDVGEDQDEDLENPDNYEAYRTYQLEKSRYYYAIVELINVDVARILYDEIDGVEVGFAINALDLRFVPSDIQFTDDPINEATEVPSGYTPPISNISAFRHSKVTCSWDLAPAKRTKILTKRYKTEELDDLYMDEYLASDHSYSEEDEDDEDRNSSKSKYRELLLNGVDEDGRYDKYGSKNGKSIQGKAGELYISFNPVVESEDSSYDSEDSPIDDREKKPRDSEFRADLDDPRFAAVFSDENYEIDITNPNFKHSEVNKSILEKRRRKLSRL